VHQKAADVDDIAVIIDVRDDDAPSATSRVISDVSTAHDTVASVSTQFRCQSDDTHGVLVVERDDRSSSPHQHVDSNRTAIDLLLWKLTELERRITLGQVRNLIPSLKIPPHLKCAAALPCEMSLSGTNCRSVSLITPLVSGVAGLNASSSSNVDTLNI